MEIYSAEVISFHAPVMPNHVERIDQPNQTIAIDDFIIAFKATHPYSTAITQTWINFSLFNSAHATQAPRRYEELYTNQFSIWSNTL